MPLKDSLTIMNRTTELLMEMPMYKQITNENAKLKEEIRHLKYQNMYLEMKTRISNNKLKKVKKMYVNLIKKYENFEEEDDVVFVEVKKENVVVIPLDEEPIKYEVVETVKPDDIYIKEEEEEEEEDVVVEVDEEEEEEQEEEEEKEEEVEEEVVEEVVEEEEEQEEEQEEEVVEVEVEEEEVEEEVVEEVEVEEEEVEEEEEEVVVEEEVIEVEVEEEEDGVYEITIKGSTYYISNEIDSFIYKEDENGEISMEVGKYVDGKPTFYKK